MQSLHLLILAAGMLGGTLGFLAAALLAGKRLRKLERESWTQAHRYYSQKFHDLISNS